MQLYSDLVKYNMVDAIVATGASIIDMDFFEAIGFKHCRVRNFKTILSLEKITLIEFMIPTLTKMNCRHAIKQFAILLIHWSLRPHTSREFIYELGKFLKKIQKEKLINRNCI